MLLQGSFHVISGDFVQPGTANRVWTAVLPIPRVILNTTVGDVNCMKVEYVLQVRFTMNFHYALQNIQSNMYLYQLPSQAEGSIANAFDLTLPFRVIVGMDEAVSLPTDTAGQPVQMLQIPATVYQPGQYSENNDFFNQFQSGGIEPNQYPPNQLPPSEYPTNQQQLQQNQSMMSPSNNAVSPIEPQANSQELSQQGSADQAAMFQATSPPPAPESMY